MRQRTELEGIRGQLVNRQAHELRRLGVQPYRGTADENAGTVDTMHEQFISDLDLIQYGQLYSSSFTEKLATDVAAIRTAENAARRNLGLQPVR